MQDAKRAGKRQDEKAGALRGVRVEHVNEFNPDVGAAMIG
jgi:hypothetical protein